MAPYPEYPLPANEVQRLRELERRSVLDTGGDEHFDRIVQLASEVLGMPVALISLVDRDRQSVSSRLGIATKETPREMAFCAHAIADEGVFSRCPTPCWMNASAPIRWSWMNPTCAFMPARPCAR
jgi:GAF domain-containing protein